MTPTREQIMAATGRELDAYAAQYGLGLKRWMHGDTIDEKSFLWFRGEHYVFLYASPERGHDQLFSPTTSLDAAALLRAECVKRGLGREFVNELHDILFGKAKICTAENIALELDAPPKGYAFTGEWIFTTDELLALTNATAEQITRAALMALAQNEIVKEH